ncbi:unnamed protein product [Arabidopsis halleri]
MCFRFLVTTSSINRVQFFSSCLPNFTRSKISPPKRFHRRILSTASKEMITRRRGMRGRRWRREG